MVPFAEGDAMSRSTITPHTSHVMGTVEGESRCKRCWSAPDWAIIEEPCPSEGRAPDDGDGASRGNWFAPWSDADVTRAYELYLARVPVSEIAVTLGRTLHATVRRIKVHRAAIGAAPVSKRTTSRETLAQIAAMPGTAREVAAATGASMATVDRARAAARRANEQKGAA